MLTKLSEWLYRVVHGRIVLFALVVLLLFVIFVFPKQMASPEGAGEQMFTPDTSLWYSGADLYTLAENYGQAGRNEFVRAHFTFDLIWPAVYLFALLTALTWVFGKLTALGMKWRWVNLLPIAGVIFDLLENITTSLVMAFYPIQLPVIGALAPVFTLVRWLLLGASVLLLIAGAVVLGWRKVSGE